jgi:protein phosphatase
MPTITFACLTDPGRTHSRNDDRWYADPGFGLFIVSDGMAVAEPPQLVVDLLPGLIQDRLGAEPNPLDESAAAAIRPAIAEVSEQIHATALEQPESGWLGLGATVAVAVVHWPHALLAHLGDSRIYLHRGGRLEAMTRDHSFVEYLVETGKLTRAQVTRTTFNGGPTRFAGMADEAVAETRLVELHEGDRLLLCSDGLPCMLDDAAIQDIMNAHLETQAACRALVDAATEAGGEDNITVIVVAPAA